MRNNRLKEERIKNGFTQKQVAEYLNISISAYQKYEYYRRSVHEETYKKLAKLYGVSIDYLIGM